MWLQPKKAVGSISMLLASMIMQFNSLQSLKALVEIRFIFLGINNLYIDSQPEKVLGDM